MTVQTGINNISNEWFKPIIDKKVLKNLSKRSGSYPSTSSIALFGEALMQFGMNVDIELLLKQES